MSYRLTIAAAVAVILASVSEFALINGGGWLLESIGAVLAIGLAGTLTRLSPVPSAIGATALAVAASAPMITAHPLYVKIAAALVIACCAASASGLRVLRAISGLVTYLAVWLLYLNLVQAGPQSFARVIPTATSLHHLLRLAKDGAALTKYSPPVVGTHGAELLAAGSIGLAAILVDFLAVRLRKPAIAGLPLLVLYLAPIATTAKVTGPAAIFTFVLAATGYLALLSSDGRSRLRGWGRVVTVWHHSADDERAAGADIGGLTATGRRIGLAAVCAAVMVPVLLPSLNLRHIFPGHGGGHEPTQVGLPDPVDEMNGLLSEKSPQTVLTYRSNGDSTGNYLQVYVLNYNATRGLWTLIAPTRTSRVRSGSLHQPPGLTPGTPQDTIATRISLGQVRGYDFRVFFLPLPYWPMQLKVTGSWLEANDTLMVYSGQGNHAGQNYSVTSGEIVPTADELFGPQQIPASIRQSYLGFKSLQTDQLRKIALQITRGKSTAFARAVALENWFHTSRFSYTLHPAPVPDTPDGLLTFLTRTRQGYCQQFAFAMAVLARLVGIPSRVAVGYTAGTEQAGGRWVVTTADAHAWPELYFANVGWLRFEPTPGGSTGQQTASEPAYVQAALGGSGTHRGGGPGGHHTVAPSVSPTGRPLPFTKHIPDPQAGGGPAVTSGGRGSAAPLIGWSLLALFVLAGAAPGAARLATRRRRWRSATGDTTLAGAAWQELCADLDDYGLTCRPSESPRAVARRVGATEGIDDEAREAVGRIASVVERARYAPALDTAGSIRADVTLVRRSLARSTGLAGRWRARLLPASTLAPLREGIRQALGLLAGWSPAQGEGAAS